MDSRSDYKKAYDTAKRELAEVIVEQERLEKKKLSLRKTIEALAARCEDEQIEIEPSPEAAFLLESSTLADEIRTVLRVYCAGYLRPREIRIELQKLGHDLTKYSNPQAAIHMVLKRMQQAGEVDAKTDNDGKTAYRLHVVSMKDAVSAQTRKREKA